MKPYYETELGKLYHGDCLQIMPELGVVDMILCDLPYGTTACKWDTVIPFEPLWKEYKRLIKDIGVISLTASQPFSSALVMSNIKMFKDEIIWKKNRLTRYMMAKYMPLRSHENILMFYQKIKTYNPIKERRTESSIKRLKYNHEIKTKNTAEVYGGAKNVKQVENRKYKSNDRYLRHPTTIIEFNMSHLESGLHPTQKPVSLFEYLIKAYTNEGYTVLDNCVGSGTTAIACERLNRRWIGIEIEEKYCEIAAKRIEQERKQLKMF